MMKRLQRRFIRIAVIALTVAMVLVVGIVNLFNWISVRNEWSETLSFLSQNGGALDKDGLGERMKDKNKHDRNLISESSWFSVSFDENGRLRSMNLQSMHDADEDTAAELAERAIQSGRTSAIVEDYLYQVQHT